MSVAISLGTSIGLRMGYGPFRKLVVAPIWPVLAVPQVRQWAKYNPDNPPECVRGYLSLVDNRVKQ